MTENFCFYLQNRLIHTSQTGGQQYSDSSPFSIPWFDPKLECLSVTDVSLGFAMKPRITRLDSEGPDSRLELTNTLAYLF